MAIIGVLLAGVIPVASGLVGNQSAPVGADVYIGEDAACAAQSGSTATRSVSVTVCFGASLDVSASLPPGGAVQADSNAFYYLEVCQIGSGPAPCDSSAAARQLAPFEYSFDPLMGTARIDANFGGCRVDLELTAAGAPREVGDVFHFVDPERRVEASAKADSSVSREVNVLSGTVCGQSVPVAPKADTSGRIWRSVSGSAEANLRVG